MMMTMNHDARALSAPLTIDDSDVKVLLLENIHADGRDFLRGKGYDVHTQDGALGEEELIEAITHVTLYAGWPNGMGAMGVAKKLFTTDDKESE